MRYYIIGNNESTQEEYEYAEQWLKLNDHTVINPFTLNIEGITDKETARVKRLLLEFSEAVLVLDRSCTTFELSYAKLLGKKVKYLTKQWRLRKTKSNTVYSEENEVYNG